MKFDDPEQEPPKWLGTNNIAVVGALQPTQPVFSISIEQIDEKIFIAECVNKLNGLPIGQVGQLMNACRENFHLSSNLEDVSFLDSENALKFDASGGGEFVLYQDNSFQLYYKFLKTQIVGQGKCVKQY